MLEDYIEKQPIVTKLLLNSYNKNKLVQAYLFISEDKIFLLDYALAFAKKLISDNDININKMIDSNTYPELKIINPVNNNIKKEELILLQQDFFVKPTLGKKLVYIINGADKLNMASANTILKFLEEPNDDVVAILLSDNLSKVLPTIKSRCQVLMMKNDIKTNNINDLYEFYKFNKSDEEYSIEDYNTQIGNVINFINLLEKLGLNTFSHYKDDIFDIFKTKEDFILLFDLLLYFYYDILNLKLKRNTCYFINYEDKLEKILSNNNLELIQKKLSIIEESKIKLNSNMNLKMLMDDFIIRFSEV